MNLSLIKNIYLNPLICPCLIIATPNSLTKARLVKSLCYLHNNIINLLPPVGQFSFICVHITDKNKLSMFLNHLQYSFLYFKQNNNLFHLSNLITLSDYNLFIEFLINNYQQDCNLTNMEMLLIINPVFYYTRHFYANVYDCLKVPNKESYKFILIPDYTSYFTSKNS